MHRFFCSHADFQKEIIFLTDKKEIHHLKDVLRLKEGSPIVVFNGKGTEIQGTILTINASTVSVQIKKSSEIPNPPIRIILACAIPKKAKFETIIEKCVELGVDEIIPLVTKRTEIIFNTSAKERKAERYKTVAINAAKQSKRKTIPLIHSVVSLPDALNILTPTDAAFIPCLTKERRDLIQIIPTLINNIKRIIFFIGPEGDFTLEEVELAQKHGCLAVSLGKTVLKVDTAAIAVVSLANFFYNYEK